MTQTHKILHSSQLVHSPTPRTLLPPKNKKTKYKKALDRVPQPSKQELLPLRYCFMAVIVLSKPISSMIDTDCKTNPRYSLLSLSSSLHTYIHTHIHGKTDRGTHLENKQRYVDGLRSVFFRSLQIFLVCRPTKQHNNPLSSISKEHDRDDLESSLSLCLSCVRARDCKVKATL